MLPVAKIFVFSYSFCRTHILFRAIRNAAWFHCYLLIINSQQLGPKNIHEKQAYWILLCKSVSWNLACLDTPWHEEILKTEFLFVVVFEYFRRNPRNLSHPYFHDQIPLSSPARFKPRSRFTTWERERITSIALGYSIVAFCNTIQPRSWVCLQFQCKSVWQNS